MAKTPKIFVNEPVQRTVVVADLVRYGPLVKSLESGQKLGAIATFIINNQIQELIQDALRAGKMELSCLVKSIGDGAILQFEDAVSAEQFATNLHQHSFTEHSRAATNELEWRSFRVGIFTGEVVLTANDIAGEAVGSATRLQSRAAPGETLIDVESWKQLTPQLQALYSPEETITGKTHDPVFKVRRRRIVPLPPWQRDKQDTQTIWYLPDRGRNPNFIGRSPEIEMIEKSLLAGLIAAVTEIPEAHSARRIAALVGLGGIGKTETAIEYAFRHAAHYQYVFFLHADDIGKIKRDYAQIAKLLKLSPWETGLDGCVLAVLEWMKENSRWLLIVDNVDEPEDVARYIPTRTTGHVLITTRKKNVDPVAPGYVKAVAIGIFTPEESQRFMLLSTERNVDGSPAEEEALKALTNAIAGLPVALEQAATYIRNLPCSFADYWHEFNRRRTELFASDLARPRQHEGVVSEAIDRDEAITTTWDINFRQVEREAKKHPDTARGAAPDLMLVSAFLSPDDIPLDLLSSGASELGPRAAKCLRGDSRLRVNEALHLLDQFSLIEVKTQTRAYRMHRLVQEVIRKWWMTPEQRVVWAKRVINVLRRGTLVLQASEGSWPSALKDQHFASFVASILMDNWKAEDFEFEEAAELLSQAGFLLTKMEQHREADRFLERAIAIREKLLGADHLDLAQTLSNFANNLADWGRNKDALNYYKRALEIRQQKQHQDHAAIAQIHNDYGIAYFNLGNYDDAEKHYLEALRIWKKEGDRNLIGSAYFNLAMIYRNRTSQQEKAHDHFRKAYENVSNPHMRAHACRNFGEFLSRQARNDEALPVLREGYKNAKQAFGPKSERILKFGDSLIGTLDTLGLDEEADEIRRELGEIRGRRGPVRHDDWDDDSDDDSDDEGHQQPA